MIPVNIMGLKPPNDTQLLARIVLLCNVEVELVQLLLQNNYNPNYPQNCSDIISVTIDGRTTSVDMSPLHLAMYEGQKDITELLLKYGAEVNRQTKLGKTALHMASMFGHTDALELLLQHGCDIDAVDCGNNTALAYAINGQHPSTTKLLIEGGASLENINDNDASFLDMALFFNQSEIIYYLLKCGYGCNQHFQTGESFSYYGSHYTNSILFSLILNNDVQND